jgi:hypothetical protein
MLLFFSSLDPNRIFHRFNGRPADGAFENMGRSARRNLDFARHYLLAKLLATGILEAIAESSGGDAPMALFMGDVPGEGAEVRSLVSLLADPGRPPWVDEKNPVYLLLRDGRLEDSSFDLRNSPLALHLYHALPPPDWKERIDATLSYFEGRLGARDLLGGFPASLVAELTAACALMVPSRGAALRELQSGKGSVSAG